MIQINGTTVVTTDSSSYNTHFSSWELSNLKLLSAILEGREGQMLIWKNGGPQWVDMPTNFQNYFNQLK